MKEIDIKKWSLKIVSLLLAVLLWFYVGIEKNPFEQRTFQVPVTMTHLSDELSAEMSVKNVNVTVRGRSTRLRNIDVRDFKANVDLSQVKIGDNSCEVNVRAPSGVYVSKISPNEINVTVEHAEGAHFEVKLEKIGELPSGKKLKDVKIEPKSVFVSGEQSVVNAIDEVKVQLDLSQINGTGSVELPLELIGKDGRSVDMSSVEMRSRTAKVSYVLDKDQEKKSVPITATFRDGAGSEIQVRTIRPASVLISGDKEDLEKVAFIATEPIDARSINGEKTIRVKLKIPEGIKADIDQVEILLVPKGTGGNTFRLTVPIQIQGLPASSVVLSQKEVTVEYQGNQGTDSGLTAVVNVSGLASGIHQVPVVVLPANGVQVTAITPAMVQVTISRDGQANGTTNSSQGLPAGGNQG